MTSQSTSPFGWWQRMLQDWSKAAGNVASASNPLEAWQQAMRGWSAPAAQPQADPWRAWQDSMASWVKTAASASPLTGFPQGAEGTGGTNPADVWLTIFQKWAEASSQFLNMGRAGSEPGLFNPFQAFNPFQGFAPAQVWQQLLQQYMNTWTDFLAKGGDTPPSSELFRNSERSWLAHLDSTGQELSAAMSTEEFAKALGISLEQALAHQQRLMQPFEDQVNAFLRFFHLPSRTQVDRLFERVIGLEQRLDELEDQNRAILKLLTLVAGGTAGNRASAEVRPEAAVGL